MKDFFIGIGSVLLGIVIGIAIFCCIILGIEWYEDLYVFQNWVNKNILNK